MDEMASAAQVGTGGDPASQNRRPWLQTPLEAAGSFIRILILHKGFGDMPITCGLKVASLDDDPYFESLSYVWGDPEDTRSISVGAVTFKATTNLFEFLRCLRLPSADRYLWADAICIDQLNSREKMIQISLMSKIYQQAKESHVWFGHFRTTGPNSWESELTHGGAYQLASQFSPDMWNRVEQDCLKDLKYFRNAEGFRPLSLQEAQEFQQRCRDDIFLETLRILDRIAAPRGGQHLCEYPVFSFVDRKDGGRQYEVTKGWPMVIDCILWLLTAPWWTRVWTLQEAVLPQVDPIVHCPPYTFKLSRLVNGIHTMRSHTKGSCCKWFDHVILTSYRHYPGRVFDQAVSVCSQRQSLVSRGRQSVPLHDVVHSIRRRRATEIRDYWYGIVGFLRPEQQEEERKGLEWTTTETFTKCSKLILSQSKDLTRLSYAKRLRQSKVVGLPSWALDLSAPARQDDADFDNWELYNASGGLRYELVSDWTDLGTPLLTVQARRVGTVFARGASIPLDAFEDPDPPSRVVSLIQDWHALYHKLAPSPDENAFWRTTFMDRDPQRHWMHKRERSLPARSVAEIRKWWKHWEQTGDRRDLDANRNAGDGSRGAFQYRALSLAVEKTTFFITIEGLPGMGPHDLEPLDELYALRGCKSLAVLRRGSAAEAYSLKFVGLCFVDTWMYGRATQGNPVWETLELC